MVVPCGRPYPARRPPATRPPETRIVRVISFELPSTGLCFTPGRLRLFYASPKPTSLKPAQQWPKDRGRSAFRSASGGLPIARRSCSPVVEGLPPTMSSDHCCLQWHAAELGSQHLLVGNMQIRLRSHRARSQRALCAAHPSPCLPRARHRRSHRRRPAAAIADAGGAVVSAAVIMGRAASSVPI